MRQQRTTGRHEGAHSFRRSFRRGLQPPLGRRAAFTLLEVLVTCILLGAVLATLAPVMKWVGEERRASEQRQLALHASANLLERIAARPWDEVTSELASTVVLPEHVVRALPEPELTVEIIGPDADAEPAGKRIAVHLRWKDRTGTFTAPVRLTAWVYQ